MCLANHLDASRVAVVKNGAASSIEFSNGRHVVGIQLEVEHIHVLAQPFGVRRFSKDDDVALDEQGFGNCTNTRACEAVCPKNETISNIARLNREMIKAKLAD